MKIGEQLKFDYTGKIEEIQLEAGKYQIEAWGASGGSKTTPTTAGKGAYSLSYIETKDKLTIKILVGEIGSSGSTAGGGGGGTFVSTIDNEPIVVAGGGGGDEANRMGGAYAHGQATKIGGCPLSGSLIGEEGQGGNSGSQASSGGGGFYSDGQNSSNGWGAGGNSFIKGGAKQTAKTTVGSPYGGFGGGASTHGNSGGGAGAGGYTGGSGGVNSGNSGGGSSGSGGGGGSYFIGKEGLAIAGNLEMPSPSGDTQIGQEGNGYCIITFLGGSINAKCKINGQIKQVNDMKVKVNGTWKNVTKTLTKINGIWK